MPKHSGTKLVREQKQTPTKDEPYYTSLKVVKREYQFKAQARLGRQDACQAKSMRL